MPKSRTEQMVDRLRDLQAGTPDVEASAVVSVDGLIMASSLPAGVEEDRVSAMSAAMLSLGERIASELGRGQLRPGLHPRQQRLRHPDVGRNGCGVDGVGPRASAPGSDHVGYAPRCQRSGKTDLRGTRCQHGHHIENKYS